MAKHIRENKANEICIYCGVKLNGKGGCAEDYGLHTPYIEDFYNKQVCPKCDLIVTQTNRLLKRVIDSNEPDTVIPSLQAHMKIVYEYCRSTKQEDGI